MAAPSAPAPALGPPRVDLSALTIAPPSDAPVHPTSVDWSFPELQPPPPSGPRVELTFRDGTSASLDDVQARALDDIARVLTCRDGVKH
ncbi:MAG: hypothetical protein NVS3B26_10850 [Mycobacteriales bacterium]